MSKKSDKFEVTNIVRIKDKTLFDKLNKLFDKYKTWYSKNRILNEVLETGINVFEKLETDSWAFQHSRQTILDAMQEQTKRMNYFIKFSKPFIRSSYANGELAITLLLKICNYLTKDMSEDERQNFMKYMLNEKILPDDFKDAKDRMYEAYDYKVD